MSTCSFFGHSVCPESIQPKLKTVIENLINNHNVKDFLLGDHEKFDVLVLKTIKELSSVYDIKYKVVLSYMPQSYSYFGTDSNSVYMEEMASVHKKFAIEFRNNYLVKNCDYFITYITHSYGGAAKFAKKAQSKNKVVINLTNYLI